MFWLLPGSSVARDAETISECLTAAYRRWDAQHDAGLVDSRVRLLIVSERVTDPLGRACLEVAEHVTQWGGHPYHSDRHHAEVRRTRWSSLPLRAAGAR